MVVEAGQSPAQNWKHILGMLAGHLRDNCSSHFSIRWAPALVHTQLWSHARTLRQRQTPAYQIRDNANGPSNNYSAPTTQSTERKPNPRTPTTQFAACGISY